jgi:hypothetical protein
MDIDSPTGGGSFRELPDADDDRFTSPDGEEAGGTCQLCGATPARVESFMYVMSFLLLTRHAEYEACLCRACATRLAVKEQAKSALLGWWGIPWGLMTFKALWINARTLMRWSTVGAAGAAAAVLLGLAVPITAGLLFYDSDQGRARRAGNWMDEQLVERFQEGQALHDAGDVAGALAVYREVYRKAEGSSIVNFSIAQAQVDLGDAAAALPYAAAAERIEGDDPAYPAMHGWLLQVAGRETESAERHERLRGAEPRDATGAVWMSDFFEARSDHAEQLRAVDAGLAFEPDEPALLARRLSALVALDRSQEAEALVAAQPPDLLDQPVFAFPMGEYRMLTDPATATEELVGGWMDSGLSDFGMRSLVNAARNAGALEPSRRRIEDFLFAADTPGDAWASARPWFDDDAWAAGLDRYLARRPEVLPALLRMALYDPLADAEAIRRLGERVRDLDHPLAQYVEGVYFNYAFPGRSMHDHARAVERHLAEAPQHALCVLRLAWLQAGLRPAEARALLPQLRELAADDAALLGEVALLDAEISLHLGEAEQALAGVQGIEPASLQPYSSPGDVHSAVAEAAFHAGNRRLMEEHLRQVVGESGDAASHAAALLVRWSEQLAAGRAVTYREDADAWLARWEAEAGSELSAAVQALLAAEGRVPRAERQARLAPELGGTFDLVALFKRAAESGETDWDEVRAIAESPHAFQYAPTLARRVLERTGRAAV